MKKIILSSFVFLSLSLSGFSQDNIIIKVDAIGQGTVNPTGDNTDYSSGHTAYVFNTTSSTLLDIYFDVENNTGSTKSWRISRYKDTDVPSDWTHTLCVGNSCFLNSSLNPYCTPANTQAAPNNSLDLDNGEAGEISMHVTMPSQGSATYHLYLGDCTTFEDSITIQINYAVGVKEVKQAPSFSMYPNPANDLVSIQMNNSKNGVVKIVDLVGNIIYSETITSSSKLNTSEFKNGIYFVTIEVDGAKMASRKLVVKH